MSQQQQRSQLRIIRARASIGSIIKNVSSISKSVVSCSANSGKTLVANAIATNCQVMVNELLVSQAL